MFTNIAPKYARKRETHPPWVKNNHRLDSNDFFNDFLCVCAGVGNVISYNINISYNLSCLLQTCSLLSIIEKLFVS